MTELASHDNGSADFDGAGDGKYNGEKEHKIEDYKKVPEGTRIVSGMLNGEIVEMNPVNTRYAFQRTIEKAAEYIRTQGKVTLVIPLMGGIPLADGLVRYLAEPTLTKQGFDLSRIDFRFAKKIVKGFDDVKKEPIHGYVLDNEERMEGSLVMIDDIFDGGEAYSLINEEIIEKLLGGRMICFTPFIKDGVEESDNEYEIASQVKARKRGYSISSLTEIGGIDFSKVNPSRVKELHADINYTVMLENAWMNSGAGMNSGYMEGLMEVATEEIWLEALAIAQAHERYLPVVLSGYPKNLDEYFDYMKTLCKNVRVDSPSFGTLLEIEKIHFVQQPAIGIDEAKMKMAKAREYFEGLRNVDFLHTGIRADAVQ